MAGVVLRECGWDDVNRVLLGVVLRVLLGVVLREWLGWCKESVAGVV